MFHSLRRAVYGLREARERPLATTVPDAFGSALSPELLRRIALLLIGICVCAGAVIDLHALREMSIWYDEAVAVEFARMPISTMLHALLHRDAFFGFYYLLLHFVMLFGSDERTIRLISIAAGVSFVASIAALAWRLAGPKAGVAAAALATCSPIVVFTSREARPYSLLLVFSTLMTMAFLDLVERPSKRSMVIYGLTAIIGCYVDVFAIYIVVAHGVWCSVYHRRLLTREFAVTTVVVVVALLPLVAAIFAPGHVNDFLTRPTMRIIVHFMRVFAGSWAALVADVILVTLASYFTRRTRGHADETAVLLVLLLGLPPVLALAVTVVKPVFEARYLYEAYPALLLILATSAARFPRVVTGATVTVLVVLSIHPALQAMQPTEDWLGAERYIASGIRPGEPIVVFPGFQSESYRFYSPKLLDGHLAAEFMTQPSSATPILPTALTQSRDVWLITAEFNGDYRVRHQAILRNELTTHSVRRYKKFVGPIEVYEFHRLQK